MGFEQLITKISEFMLGCKMSRAEGEGEGEGEGWSVFDHAGMKKIVVQLSCVDLGLFGVLNSTEASQSYVPRTYGHGPRPRPTSLEIELRTMNKSKPYIRRLRCRFFFYFFFVKS